MRFFFYGTLLDHDVMALVLGRRLPPIAFAPAALAGHARRRAKGVSFPIIVHQRSGKVNGAVVRGLSARDVARLVAYEGPSYRVVPLRVRTPAGSATVSVFEPLEKRYQPSRRSWDLAEWQRRDKRAFLARLRRAFSARPAC